jgi:hypothetical protein
LAIKRCGNLQVDDQLQLMLDLQVAQRGSR